ncbi:uncharacterized protein BO72DRAFT_479362 [Aspergillus fijiensis CBS 313.89]|uniref:Uncharacterized protein n=1 Tax=Aspergillus fijiensis CBS 313.89 TaxID=1448319 RepID=A0A8G1RL37_9EURO|nr:uncharacterized protein BO72DRAFT_479362 [Aspergillus fijiensis CBS 313.89]RAK74668.1 hypothetical protein BO72DRAFT_479362 [Aspergillus fijiensis CBS 313.89]
MSQQLLPKGQRERLWSPMADLLSDEGFRTLRPGSSKFTLLPEQVEDWPDFAKEVKALLAPHCGKFEPFVPVVPREVFAVANELGLQGRLVQNALHPVGEVADLLKLGVRFGDSQYGINRLLVEFKKQTKRDAKAETKRKVGEQTAGGKLVPDLVIADTKTHATRGVGEAKTLWKFEPGKKQTWKQFIADKLGQLARYMDDHHDRYGFRTIYERTWFVKRVSDSTFAMSPPISSKARSSATEVSLRECFLAFAIRAADPSGSRYDQRAGLDLVERLAHDLVHRYGQIARIQHLFDARLLFYGPLHKYL